MKNKIPFTKEELQDNLCKYCSATDFGESACIQTPNGLSMCEGMYCDDAYVYYLDDCYSDPENTRMKVVTREELISDERRIKLVGSFNKINDENILLENELESSTDKLRVISQEIILFDNNQKPGTISDKSCELSPFNQCTFSTSTDKDWNKCIYCDKPYKEVTK